MEKNDKFIGTCVGYTSEGLGVVKHDNFIYFVKDLLLSEEAEIVVTSVKKSFGYGKRLQLIKTSDDRCQPKCPSVKWCGGCQIQHMNLHGQTIFKQQRIKDCFRQIEMKDDVIKPILMMDNGWQYRNKVQVPVQYDNSVKIGFYKMRTNEIVPFDFCHVQSDTSNKIIENLKNYVTTDLSLRHILIKHALFTDEIMLVYIVKKYRKGQFDKINDKLIQQFPMIKTIVVNINTQENNVILGDKEIILMGNGLIQEKCMNLLFNISSKSFFQINPYQTEVLYSKAIELAQLSGNEVVLDCYCGTGTIALIASQHAKEVYGIEIVKEAIEDAKTNAIINHITNCTWLAMDAKDGVKELLERNVTLDVVFLDPPRKGCDEATINSVIAFNPKRIVYVSCEPSTCARDCALLMEHGYEIMEIQPVDMFPQTYHVETVCLLTHNG